MTDERFEKLLDAYLEGERSPNILRELRHTLQQSDRYRQRFQEDNRLNVLLRESFSERIELQDMQSDTYSDQDQPAGTRKRLGLRVAAGITIALVLSGLWFRYYGPGRPVSMGTCLYVSGSGQAHIERGRRDLPVTAQTPILVGDRFTCDAQNQAMLRLLDGTLISLEPKSVLSFPNEEQLGRVEVEQGEALFEITKRPTDATPFRVRTQQATVEVLGTTFTLEAAGNYTQVAVYEGQVTFTRIRDGHSVQVQSEQKANTESDTLNAEPVSDPAPLRPVSVMSLLPTDDQTLEYGRRKSELLLMVEGDKRTSYLRFDIPPVGVITHARLRLTQTIDPGSGTLTVYAGNHHDWSEDRLTQENAPQPTRTIAQRTGAVQRRETIELDVSSLIHTPGPITLILTLDKGDAHDIWFGSKESAWPPQLVLTYTKVR